MGKSSTCNILCGDKVMHGDGYLANAKDAADFAEKNDSSSNHPGQDQPEGCPLYT